MYIAQALCHIWRESVNSGLDYWNGLLDWTTGLTFDLKFTFEIGYAEKDVICGATWYGYMNVFVTVYVYSWPVTL